MGSRAGTNPSQLSTEAGAAGPEPSSRRPWPLRRGVVLGLLFATGIAAFAFACGSDPTPECAEQACADAGADTSSSDAGLDSNLAPDAKDATSDAQDASDASDAESECPGPAGTLDPTFGDGGIVWLKYPGAQAHAVASQPDGKIVIAGGTAPRKHAIVRLLADGSLDPGFGSSGLVETTVLPTNTQALRAVVVQPDGKIVAAGAAIGPGPTSYDFVVLRYNSDGTPDATFGTAGVALTDFGNTDDYPRSAALQPDGKILVGGYLETGAVNATGNLALARYNVDGSLDTAFGTGGRVTIDVRGTQDIAGQILLLPNGSILFAASVKTQDNTHYELGVVRLDANGALDPTFADGGKFLSVLGGRNAGAASMAVQPGGRLLVGGLKDQDFVLVGLTTAGAVDPTFGVGGVVVTDFSTREDVVQKLLVDNGRITAVGLSQDPVQSATRGIALSRYDMNGFIDPTFGTAGKTVTLPPPNADLGALSAVTTGCTSVTVGSWLYNENTVTQLAMGVARYRR